MKLSEIDQNFMQKKTSDAALRFYSIPGAPFCLYGVSWNEELGFFRMEQHTAQAVSEAVGILSKHTAGGRLRFRTNSRYLALRVWIKDPQVCGHMTYLATAGFDVYSASGEKWEYAASLIPDWQMADTQCICHDFGTRKERELLLEFPLYAKVQALEIGLDSSAEVCAARGYTGGSVVFYGSSITQGGCASRPGLSYPAILSRQMDFDYLNLGFSGAAMAEDNMVEYLCGLAMDVLVLDYDHNAPTAEYLRRTHERVYRKIRSARPTLAIVMASAPMAHLTGMWKERRQIVRQTYLQAKQDGDNRVWFVDGNRFFPIALREECSIDGIHPNDLGMAGMAKAFAKPLEQALACTAVADSTGI